MKLIVFAIILTIVAYASCTDYQWGEVNSGDYLIADDNVKKHSWLFNVPTVKYNFKQKKGDKLTISGISILDKKGKCKADVTLTKGGPGKTTATLEFVGQQRGKSFKCHVKIWGYQ